MKELETSKTNFINYALSQKAVVYNNSDKEYAEKSDKYFQRKIKKMISLGIFEELERIGFIFGETTARQSKEYYATPAILSITPKEITKRSNISIIGKTTIGLKYSLNLVSSADWKKRYEVPTDIDKLKKLVLEINISRGE